MKDRLIDAYNEGWSNGRKRRNSHFYGMGHLPAENESAYARGYADAVALFPVEIR
jgi:hypothetical protein